VMIESILRFFLVLSVLSIASFLDVKSQSVPNKLWYIAFCLTIPFLLYDLLSQVQWYWVWWFYSFYGTLFISYIFWRLGVLGGADGKCLIFISLLYPFYPQLGGIFELSTRSGIFFNCFYALKIFLPFSMFVLFFGMIFSVIFCLITKRRGKQSFIPFIMMSFLFLCFVIS